MEVTEERKTRTTTNTGGGGSTKIRKTRKPPRLPQMDSTTAWFLVGLFSSTFFYSAIGQLIDTCTNSSVKPLLFQFVGMALGVVHLVIETSVYFMFRHAPHKLFGPFAITSIQGVTAFCALIFGQCKDPDPMFFILLVSGCLDFFAFARLMHTATDIYVVEVLFGGLMQIMVYLTGDNLYICISVSILSSGFILEMYRTYTSPNFLITCSKIKGVDDC